ncbi:MAG: right-handed parallel beta-helix repeat-containing protein [Clostridia bacterium]|nr:right-handed parallel beta-helix repeat-containing protein [Clostridia bacterium]
MRICITEFGAIADGVTKCTEAINKAITCVAEAGGGYVTVPSGEFVSGTIELKSNVYLELDPGAVILGSMEKGDFHGGTKRHKGSTLILGQDIHNCGVIGKGTLNLRRDKIGYTKEHGRPSIIVFIDCHDIMVKGISLIKTGFFTIYSVNNTNATFDSLTLDTSGCENGDGIDFSGSRNVTISNCNIKAGDDAIGLKTHWPDAPCENFTITNCNLSSNWAGVRIGPETCGDMLNISISNCVFNDCSDGIKIQLCENYRMEDLTFSNLNMVNVLRAVFMTSNSCPMSSQSTGVRPNPGVFKRVLMSNIIAHMGRRPQPGWFESQFVMIGLPEAPIEDIMMSNIHVVAPGGGTVDKGEGVRVPELINNGNYPDLLFEFPQFPCSAMYIKNAARIRMSNCVFEIVNSDERPAIVAENVDGMRLYNSVSYNTSGLLRHYRINNLKTIECEGEITTLSPEFAASWDDFREKSLEEEARIIENAKVYDAGKKGEPVLETVMPEKGMTSQTVAYEYSDGRIYLLTQKVNGSPTIKVNGKEIVHWDREAIHSGYNFGIRMGFELTEYLIQGKNEIEISLQNGMFGAKGISLYAVR